MILWAGCVSRKWAGLRLGWIGGGREGRKKGLCWSGLLSDWSEDGETFSSASLVSLLLEGALHPSPHSRRLVTKGLVQSSPCILQLELAGLGNGLQRPAPDLLRPSCLEFHGPFTLCTSPPFLSALLSAFSSLPHHGLSLGAHFDFLNANSVLTEQSSFCDEYLPRKDVGASIWQGWEAGGSWEAVREGSSPGVTEPQGLSWYTTILNTFNVLNSSFITTLTND